MGTGFGSGFTVGFRFMEALRMRLGVGAAVATLELIMPAGVLGISLLVMGVVVAVVEGPPSLPMLVSFAPSSGGGLCGAGNEVDPPMAFMPTIGVAVAPPPATTPMVIGVSPTAVLPATDCDRRWSVLWVVGGFIAVSVSVSVSMSVSV